MAGDNSYEPSEIVKSRASTLSCTTMGKVRSKLPASRGSTSPRREAEKARISN
ncbi:hypothetical protein OI25_7258 [Paraburkholderia fungorum]|uniref:Uncharacterized protein n=1 Tax=Paraburkholderia fungorum TaxID=134537 RepID=A0AAU8STG6_9BURK|nr:hypothetical protein OI25_7258 [Paraburkholderia fungorum]PRZ49242.1 hypothetical protein BX589_126151 [Paraburkholderia fungorum]